MAGEKILTVSLPIFALIFSGYGAGRLRLLNEPAIVGLNGFVFYFALPALLFIKMAEAPLLEAWDWRFLAGYLTGGFAVFALAMLFGRVLFGHGLAVLGLQGLAAAWPNVGYMGLPLVITAFGEKATLPAVLIIVFDALVTLSIAIALVEAGLGRGGRWLDVAKTVGSGLARNPLLLWIFAGALVSVSGFSLHPSVEAFGTLLGAAALPCALFSLGASLVGRPVTAGMGEVSLVVGLKLLVHPLVVWLMVTHVFRLDPLWATVAVLDAALPVAANVFVLARRYDVYVERSSAIVLTSTTASVVTVSALLTLLSPR